jgi:hypothetical protein
MWKTLVITVGGTMQNVKASDNLQNSVLVTYLFAQMLLASSGQVGYLALGVPVGSNTPDHSKAIQLAAATSTVPGTPFVWQAQDRMSGERISLAEVWADGAHNGDTMLIVYYEVPK